MFAIRISVKSVRGSDGRKQKFEQCVKQVEIDVNVGLCLDVSTRWNSTYFCLKVLSHKKRFLPVYIYIIEFIFIVLHLIINREEQKKYVKSRRHL